MSDPKTSKYWLDQVATNAIASHPEGEIVVSSGHSPSGFYHIGTIRETLTASAIAWAINQQGGKARHIDVVDDFDVLRKLPAGVPESYAEHLGKPLYLAPNPFGEGSYADYFLTPLLDAFKNAGVTPEIMRAHEFYASGRMTSSIEAALEKLDEIKQILLEVGGRAVAADWVPVQLLSDNDSLKEWTFTDWDKDKQVIYWKDKAGEEGELDYTKGRVKLDWRLDWPARWAEFGVGVEPFGRDHATKGGSYDTGKVLVQKIFGGAAPVPVPYEFILPAGENKKFSKSAGNVITPTEALEVMPAEILRYFVLKPLPAKTLYFDSGLPLYNLIDEYAKAETAVRADEPAEFGGAYLAAAAGGDEQTISTVPFSHLVAVHQAAWAAHADPYEILERTGYAEAVKNEKEVIEREFTFVRNWLEKYAPESVKFSLQREIPDVEVTTEQAKFLGELATRLDQAGKVDAQGMHELIYAARESVDIKPGVAFQAIYRIFLAKDSGPKAGWFLASLDQEKVLARLNHFAKGV